LPDSLCWSLRWCGRDGSGSRAGHCPVRMKPPAAFAAAQAPDELVRADAAVARCGESTDRLGGDEVFFADKSGVARLRGDCPLLGGVPSPRRRRTVSDGVAISVGPLPVPDLSAGIAGVGEDRRDGAQRPAVTGAVPVTFRVGAGRARYPAFVEGPGDAGRRCSQQVVGRTSTERAGRSRGRGRGGANAVPSGRAPGSGVGRRQRGGSHKEGARPGGDPDHALGPPWLRWCGTGRGGLRAWTGDRAA
jgi:hypothetical protein